MNDRLFNELLESVEEAGAMKRDNIISIQSILDKLESGKFPESTYVGLKYTKLDLINELKVVQAKFNKIVKEM